MLISKFTQATGLTRDTVRFYMRLGLLRPKTDGKGGRHPYHLFTDEDVQVAQVIRIARSLGMSLKEIAALSEERRKGRVTRDRSIEVLRGQLARLETKAAELETLAGYLRANIKWLAAGGQGQPPDFRDYGNPPPAGGKAPRRSAAGFRRARPVAMA
jgi:MerR family transcriptional regulator, copper efflux regulator